MKRVFFAMLLAGVATGCLSAHAATPTLRDAQGLYFQSRVAEAETAFQAIADDAAASPTDRASAWRSLARIHWLIDRDSQGALTAVDRARATGAELCAATLLRIRVLDESDHAQEAAMEARARVADCPGEAQGTDLKGAEAMAWLDEAAIAAGQRRDNAIAAAGEALSKLSPLAEASPKAQALKLDWALQSGDGRAALSAWKSFFWLTDHNAPAPLGLSDAEVERRFQSGVKANASVADQAALLSMLIRAGFYKEGRRFDQSRAMGDRAGDNPDYRMVQDYYRLRESLDPELLAFNRATARGKGDNKAFNARLKEIVFAAAKRIDPKAEDPRPVLQKTFGIYGTIGETGGYTSMHAGHVAQDDRLNIDQFGRKGEVRFMLVDNMISNGYQSWLWDGGAEAGGWSGEGGTIVQVRSAYTGGGLNALAAEQPDIAARLAARQPELEQQDLKALAGHPVAYLPGLQARLTRQANAQVSAKAHAEANRSGQPYPRVFAKFYWDALVGHSIVAHEGRHSLDNFQFTGAARLGSPELEYRAKLSELQLAEFPRMPLANIQSNDIGSDTPHGQADTRVMQGYFAWMEAHRGEIAGFDPNIPTLEQLDKLTDAQIRVVAKGLDPQFLHS